LNNYYCLKCNLNFKGEKDKCPQCGKKAKLIGREAFFTHGHNLPK